MSGVMATTASGTSPGDAAAPRSWGTPGVRAAIISTSLIALALSDGLKPQTGAANVPRVNAAWDQAFSHAQYVILTATNARRIAWSPQLQAYLASHFRQVYRSPRKLLVYVRNGLPAG